MRVLVSRFSEAGIAGIFVYDDDVDVSATEGEDIIFKAIPLSAHDGEGAVYFLLVDDHSLLLDILERRRAPVGVGCDHFLRVPEFE